MAIQKIKISNFKCFKGLFEIELNKGLNILVGNNETGKSTILEAIHIALTGLYGGRNIRNELSQYLFNKEVVDSYINSVNNGTAFVDEIQDMAGYDLEIIKCLFSLNSDVLLVGDPRQVTYHTHDEAKYKKYIDGNIKEFIEQECSEFSVDIDETTLNKTYRNNKPICKFANSIYSNFKPCEYVEHKPTGHDGVFFVSPSDVDAYLSTYQPMQLRDTRRTSVNSTYPVINLGESKGLTFQRVLIYPTSKMLDWILDHKKEMKPQSKSKFYVGITRAEHSVAIVFDNKKGISVDGITNFHF